jgi:hypothetical protein
MTDKQRRNQHRIKLEFAYNLASAVKLISLMVERLDNHPQSQILEAKALILFDQIQNIKKS